LTLQKTGGLQIPAALLLYEANIDDAGLEMKSATSTECCTAASN